MMLISCCWFRSCKISYLLIQVKKYNGNDAKQIRLALVKGCISYWIGVKLYWVNDDICSHLALLFEQLFVFVIGWEV